MDRVEVDFAFIFFHQNSFLGLVPKPLQVEKQFSGADINLLCLEGVHHQTLYFFSD